MSRPRWLIPVGVVALVLTLLTVFASIGGPHSPLTGLFAVLYALIRAGAPALAYVAGSAGLGRVFLPWIRPLREAPALQVALGLAAMLSLSHLLGMLGLLSGRAALPVGAGVVAAGIILLAQQLASRGDRPHATISPAWLLGLPALALLLLAACQPPGWLWDSEAGGYDALSYHLQLPQEWLARGRIWPNEHNVFSFLPSYVEAAFVHLAALTGAPIGATAGSRAAGLLVGEGMGVISCQILSACFALIAVGLVSRLCVAACRRAGLDAPSVGAFAGVLLLSTPWTIVAGSLAYNDLVGVAFIAAAMLVALDEELSAVCRGVLCGFLIGVACDCKPTAILFGAPPVGIALLVFTPARRWVPMILSGAGAGLLTLAPWLIRNWLAARNPVFPLAATWFGSAHWSADQVHRYASAVSFHGSLLDRLRLLILIDPADPAGARHRGMLHPQWVGFFGIALAAAVVTLVQRPTRRVGAIIGAGMLAQLIAWLLFTHIQSRFLLPLTVPGCVLFAMAIAPVGRPGPEQSMILSPRVGFAILVCIVQTTGSVLQFGRQRGGRPNQLLVAGPAIRTGEAFRRELASMSASDRAAAVAELPPEPFVNLALPVGSTVYLLGDATPLYFTAPVLYNTTWDSWPLAQAMRAAPGDPAAWSRALMARGVRFVLVNPSEIERLIRSGWADPLIAGESVSNWLAHGARLVKQWPGTGIALFELLPSPPEAEPSR